MRKLLRIINQNRRQIIIAVLAIVFVIMIRQAMNNVAKENYEYKKQETENMIEYSKENTSTYKPSYSVSTGNSVGSALAEENIKLINTFIENCNNGNTQKAYDMLSADCKNELYPTLESFIKNYYNKNFGTQKLCSTQLWSSNSLTYKIELYDDMLATGKIDNSENVQDYFTIVRENEDEKLNISEYIGEKQINKSVTKNDIVILVENKKVYKDYEKYTVKITNKTEKDILIDSKESTKNVYLVGSSGATYSSYLYELSDTKIKVKSYHENVLTIKFNKQHTSNTVSKIMCFDDIILDADEYREMTNKKNYKNRVQINVNM